MAFNFQAYRNPYVSTIAELLSRGEDAKAKALVDVANTQAQAMQTRAQLYGGAVENVGKMVSGFPDAIQAQKRQALNDQLTLANLTRVKGENDKLAGEADDRAAFDFAGSPGAAVEEGFTGPLPEGSPMPTREQTLARLPATLRLQAQEAYAKLDASAQGLAASKSAQAENEARTAQLDAARRDKQDEYVSTIANQLRGFKGNLPSIRQAYSHAQSSGLDPKAMEQVDAIYKQLESAATDEERVMIINAIPLHRNTIEANDKRDEALGTARWRDAQTAATIAGNKLTNETRMAVEAGAAADRKDRLEARQQQADFDNNLKLTAANAKVAEQTQKLYAALENRSPYRQGANSDPSELSNTDPETLALLRSLYISGGVKSNTTQPLSEEEFIKAKNEVDKSARAQYGLPPRATPLYMSPAKDQGYTPRTGAPPQANSSSTPNRVGGMVRMVAPNGQEKDVPSDQVAGFERLGAKRK